jgi:hypothetical protein
MAVQCASKRKSEFRLYEILPNGQLLNLYFIRKRTDSNFYQWKVGLFIGKNRKQANIWWNKNPKYKREISTGDCGLTGLRCALTHILHFANELGFNEELVIEGSDWRRILAYRYLKRYGFVDFLSEDNELVGYGIRNPEYWEYIT